MNQRTRSLTRIALFAAVLSVSAFIRIPLGPVPLTMQTFAALLTGYVLGPRNGAFATLLYTAVGLAGVPVFTAGGGPAYVLSPTFGYIIGFSCCAALTGRLATFNRSGSPVMAYIIMLAGMAAIYIPGLLWLAVSLTWIADTPSAMTTILRVGLLVPAAGDLITAVPAAALSVRLRKKLS